jgi:EAL domain-containing protein (putative c-di-GMP-specific phosphodiesterase class I)
LIKIRTKSESLRKLYPCGGSVSTKGQALLAEGCMIPVGPHHRHKPRIDDRASAASPLGAAIKQADGETITMVRSALETGRLRLAYQPIVLGSDPEKIAFHEGLIRVMEPSGRIIPARDFITVVEDTEIGRLIDCAALEMGLNALLTHPDLRLSINMSARSIGYPQWTRTLKRGLNASPTIGERLILEITESSAMQVPELVIAFMDQLQDQGVAFALDDFGAGMTAFRYFKDFQFDIVKIDGQFVRGIHLNADNQVLTQALASIGRHFDMVVVAEQVEDVADAEWLRAKGIDCLQGFLFGAPTISPAWMNAASRKTG